MGAFGGITLEPRRRGPGKARVRILHVMDHSWPILSGYAIRGQSLVVAQHKMGLEPTVLTGPLHHLDAADGSDGTLEGVRHLRTPLEENWRAVPIRRRWPFLRELSVVRLLRRRIGELLDQTPFDIVHAHSPALCGLAAHRAAHSRGVPFVYEIRAFWEDAAVDQKKTRQGGLRYELSRSAEDHVVHRADAVVGIAKHIIDKLQERGVPQEQLFHVPNGVTADLFPPRPRDEALAAKLGLNGALVFGFAGSLYRYEGIAWLVNALAALRRRGLVAKLLVVGDGEDMAEVRRAIADTVSEGHVILAGRVPHDDVQQYYSVIDVPVYPRFSIPLTELTTPLKPLEAMAQAKPVLASNVGGIRELIDHERTGLLFRPGDVDDFCRQADRLIADENFRRELGQRARQEILRAKDWAILAGRYVDVYEYARRRRENAR